MRREECALLRRFQRDNDTQKMRIIGRTGTLPYIRDIPRCGWGREHKEVCDTRTSFGMAHSHLINTFANNKVRVLHCISLYLTSSGEYILPSKKGTEAMSDEQYDFGRVELLDAESIGEPGNRRFRIFARSPRGTASLWIERDQLDVLSIAIDKILAQISGGEVLRPEAMASVPIPPGAPTNFPDTPDVEFQVLSMQIGYDPDQDMILLRAAPLELIEQDGEVIVREDPEPLFSGFMTRAQATRLSSHIIGIMASGRPRCPFCQNPMEPGHICAKQNGYHPIGLN